MNKLSGSKVIANVSESWTLLSTFGVLIVAVIVCWLLMRSSDPYGLFHLDLNRLPSDDPNSPPLTEWLNMGLWPGARNFPEACKALALKNIAAARLKPGSHILDIGHGTGESLLLLLSDVSIPRPSLLVGITSLTAHHERSRRRVEELAKKCVDAARTKVHLIHGDAVWNKNVAPDNHPLRPPTTNAAEADTQFDAVLVIDCAYHFETRKRFLEQAFRRMKPGGRIALADICFSSSSLRNCSSSWFIRVFRLMPSCNVISSEEYEAQLKGIGYAEVVIDDITNDVFPGFIAFLKLRGSGWWIFSQILNWYIRSGARFVIASGTKP